MKSPFLPYLPIEKIYKAFAKAAGNELDSGKISSPESSAALAANTFGLFLDRPSELPAIPGTESFGWPANIVDIEYCARFPWSGGRHPWLDAFVETSTHILGIESKRYEPFRSKQEGKLSQAYWRPVWVKRWVLMSVCAIRSPAANKLSRIWTQFSRSSTLLDSGPKRDSRPNLLCWYISTLNRQYGPTVNRSLCRR